MRPAMLITSYRQAWSAFDNCIREGIDIKIEVCDSSHITAKPFEQYVQETFFPMVESNRELPGCAEEPVILFCDQCRED
jgi:hypothetical protein